MTQEGQSNNPRFSGFERPSPEALQSINDGFRQTVESYLTSTLIEKPDRFKVLTLLFWQVVLSGNLDQQFSVNYSDLSGQLSIGSNAIREAVRRAVQSGYFKITVKGQRNAPSRYAIQWRETAEAAEK